MAASQSEAAVEGPDLLSGEMTEKSIPARFAVGMRQVTGSSESGLFTALSFAFANGDFEWVIVQLALLQLGRIVRLLLD